MCVLEATHRSRACSCFCTSARAFSRFAFAPASSLYECDTRIRDYPACEVSFVERAEKLIGTHLCNLGLSRSITRLDSALLRSFASYTERQGTLMIDRSETSLCNFYLVGRLRPTQRTSGHVTFRVCFGIQRIIVRASIPLPLPKKRNGTVVGLEKSSWIVKSTLANHLINLLL